jgi:hypothetical protein
MTMQYQIHPDDERLAALAGGDPEVGSDAELRAHVSGCATCLATVDELSLLRSALAELPDLVPSRPLQLVPPVAEPRATKAGGWLRRLSAPIMAAGLGLVLVGAVGTSGMLDSFAPAGGAAVYAPAAPSSKDMQDHAGGAPSTDSQPDSPAPGSFSGDGLTSQPSPTANENRGSESAPSPSARARDSASPGVTESGANAQSTAGDEPTSPWLVLLLAGVAFVVTGGILRVSAPRS